MLSSCQHGKSQEIPCSCFGDGHSCQTLDAIAFCGISNECDPETFQKKCDGTSVVFCNAGKVTSVDCTTLGFAECAPDSQVGCFTPCSDATPCSFGTCINGLVCP